MNLYDALTLLLVTWPVQVAIHTVISLCQLAAAIAVALVGILAMLSFAATSEE